MMYRYGEQYGDGVIHAEKGEGSLYDMVDCCGLWCVLDKFFERRVGSKTVLVVYFSVSYILNIYKQDEKS